MSTRFLLAAGWTALIVVACVMPTDRLPMPEEGLSFLKLIHPDKLVHFGMFAVFAALWMRVGHPPNRAALVLAGGILFAIGTELLQTVPTVHRDGDPIDALADSIGVIAGVLAMRLALVRVMKSLATEGTEGRIL